MKLTLERAKAMMDKNGGWLDLRGTQITALPEGLTVGGWLDLSGTQITALPEGLTVGGWLDLSGTQITALPEGLTVGGWLYLRGTQITAKERSKIRKLTNGDYKPGRYLYADGILTHVRGCKRIGDYIVYIGKIKGKNVVSDGTYYAHCDKLRDGMEDIAFKRVKDRGADQYKGMPLETEMTIDDAVTMYLVITGACRQGSAAFVDSLGDKLKDRITIREAIEITKGQFGAERFREFFLGDRDE